MREHAKTTDIIIRFNFSPLQLSETHQAIYFGNGLTLPTVFEQQVLSRTAGQVLSKTPGKKRSTFRSELSTVAYNAFCATWIRLYKLLYLDTSHPSVRATAWIAQFERSLTRKPGRCKQEDDACFRKRFAVLLKHCSTLWNSIATVKHQEETKGSTTFVPDIEVRKRLWKEIAKVPGGVLILGGEAFLLIPYGTRERPGKVEDLESWTPRQLAIALLAIETESQYQTVEKRVSRLRKSRN